MKTQSTPVQAKHVALSATEAKLLKQVQANAKTTPSWIKFLANTACGLWY